MTKTAEEFFMWWKEEKKRKFESYCVAVHDGVDWIYVPVAYSYHNASDTGVMWFTEYASKRAAEQTSRDIAGLLVKIESQGKTISFWENGQCIWSADE